MNIYLLSRTDSVGYDEYDAFVIAADSEEEALALKRPSPDNNWGDWAQDKNIDGDKTNNNISNLEWCDDSYNLAHAHRLGLRTSAGGHNGNSKLRESDVLQIRRLYGKQGYSSKRLAYIFSVHQTTIQRAISGKRFWKHV